MLRSTGTTETEHYKTDWVQLLNAKTEHRRGYHISNKIIIFELQVCMHNSSTAQSSTSELNMKYKQDAIEVW